MKYASKYLRDGEQKKWLNLATSIGSNDQWVARECREFAKFINTGLDEVQRTEFAAITGITVPVDLEYPIDSKAKLQALLLKHFVDGISLSMIKEARPGIGGEVTQIYLVLAAELFADGRYPDDIYAHTAYRRRGTPATWLTVSAEFSAQQIEEALRDKIGSIIGSLNYYLGHLGQSRRLISITDVGERLIFMLSKPTGPKVVVAENRNMEIPTASYSFIVFNKTTNQVGVVSGSRREIGIIHYNLRHKIFKDSVAIARNDIEGDTNAQLKALVEDPAEPDSLSLMSFELKRAMLPGAPQLRVSSKELPGISQAVEALRAHWEGAKLNDLQQVEYQFIGKKIPLYTREDNWDRTYINTASKNVTNELEEAFLGQIKDRLGGINIKETRFIVQDYTTEYVVNKLLKDKTIPTDPPMPRAAEEILIKLTTKKIIAKQVKIAQRKCFNCYTKSWDSLVCPSCDQDTMRIVGEAVRVDAAEQPIMQLLSKQISFEPTRLVKYVAKKQRKKYTKSVVSIINPAKRASTFLVLVANKKDVSYAGTLVREGFGVIALLDPHMETSASELATAGCSAVSLTKAITYLLEPEEDSPFDDVVAEQEGMMLQRIADNARRAVVDVREKRPGYNEYNFETDLKSLAQAIVPDVVRLGTEYVGKSVPDGYSRYGSKVYLNSKQGTRLFGWDAKYSQTATYRLGAGDVRKQKKYIDWLMDKNEVPSQFGSLGLYAIVSNFDSPHRFDSALSAVAGYSKLNKSTRIALVEDLLLAKIVEWSLAHWDVVLDNNSEIAKVVFSWLRRKQKRQKYTISRESDWRWLEPKLNRIVGI